MQTTTHNTKGTKSDYRRLFAESAEPLRWLCYTLTGNEDLSDRILNAAREQSLRGSDHVFREWMVSWTRRLVVQACIELVQPSLASDCDLTPVHVIPAARNNSLAYVPSDALQHKLLKLDALSRFVFVLRALEGYSRRETSLLLNIGDRTCESLYCRAIDALESGFTTMPCDIATACVAMQSFAQAGD